MEKHKYINVARKQFEFSIGPLKWCYDSEHEHFEHEYESSHENGMQWSTEESFQAAVRQSLAAGMTLKEMKIIISRETGVRNGDA